MCKPQLSLIIAMYNIRDYIGECLDSCLNQEGVLPEDYEIVIVNDGSTDDSAEVALNHIDGHSNIVFLNKPNGGLSDARNYGFNHSSGKYVWFIDGDDLINKSAVKTIIDNISIDADVFIINYQELYPDGNKKDIEFPSSRLPKSVFDGCELIKTGKISFPPMMAWLQIQKREFIIKHSLSYLVNAKSEDLEYTAKLFGVAHKIFHIMDYLYIYRLNRDGSIINNFRNDLKWIKNLLNIYISVSEYVSLYSSKKYKIKVLFVIAVNIIYSIYSQDKSTFKKSKKLINLSNTNINEILIQRKTVKSFLIWFLYNCSPYSISKHLLGRK